MAEGGEGQTFTSKVSWAGKDQRLEPLLAFRTRYDQALEQIRDAPGAQETAELCWGGTPHDPLDTGFGFRTSVKTRSPKEPPSEKKDDKDKRIILRERNRWVEQVEIKSDDDPDVILKTERVRLWIANGSDGFTYFLECKPDGQKCMIKKGSPIPAEAFAV